MKAEILFPLIDELTYKEKLKLFSYLSDMVYSNLEFMQGDGKFPTNEEIDCFLLKNVFNLKG